MGGWEIKEHGDAMMTLKTMISMVMVDLRRRTLRWLMLTRLTPLKDHRAVWKMQQRGSLGETLLHILIFGNRSPSEHVRACFGFSIQ